MKDLENKLLLITEELKREHLKDWNLAQRKIWKKLVKQDVVNPKDMKTFHVFAKLFREYAQKHGKSPGVNYIKKELKKQES